MWIRQTICRTSRSLSGQRWVASSWIECEGNYRCYKNNKYIRSTFIYWLNNALCRIFTEHANVASALIQVVEKQEAMELGITPNKKFKKIRRCPADPILTGAFWPRQGNNSCLWRPYFLVLFFNIKLRFVIDRSFLLFAVWQKPRKLVTLRRRIQSQCSECLDSKTTSWEINLHYLQTIAIK